MNTNAKTIAVCSLNTALGVVILLLGSVLGLGIYVCPLIVGLSLIPIGQEYGVKYQLMLWIIISLLAMLLVPDPEENLIFAGFFGWYPALYPKLQKLPRILRLFVKLLIFNAAVIAIEALVILVLVPEAMGSVMTIILLVLGNVVFLLYDRLLPRFEIILKRSFGRFFR